MKNITLLFLLTTFSFNFSAQNLDFCTANNYRSWWDVQHYAIEMELKPKSKILNGLVTLKAKVVKKPVDTLQIDLHESFKIKSIRYKGKKLKFTRGKRVHYVFGDFSTLQKSSSFELEINYKGKPPIALNAPWDGGVVFEEDDNGKPWMGVACQGEGASVWWPCKDDPSDEPNSGVDLNYTVPNNLSAIGNGKLIAINKKVKKSTWHWRTVNPINLYDVTFYIGDYVHWSDSIQGEDGKLNLDYFVLRNNLEKAKTHFKVVPEMIHCFEDWFGPYPFYEDGFKLVEAPYLGMEHQSAIAYGNEYKMGYLGADRSLTGVGLLFDFIIVHESGHEWFGNNISINDVAYSWVHEGFTTYSESIFIECLYGKEKADKYQHGLWGNISNISPMEGETDSCDGGSTDHYDKGSAMVHMIRTIMNNDEQFKRMLREMNLKFRKATVNGSQIEHFINTYAEKDFSYIFEQYLRTNQIPVLELSKGKGDIVKYKWSNCINSFNMPIIVDLDGEKLWMYPTTEWQEFNSKLNLELEINASPDFYIKVRKN